MKLPVTIDPRKHDAVIFDLDGVVTDTASIHAATWATLFDNYLARRSAAFHRGSLPFPAMATTGNSWTANRATTVWPTS